MSEKSNCYTSDGKLFAEFDFIAITAYTDPVYIKWELRNGIFS